ncbi:MAG: hypothetical protein GXC76_02890 [Rhodanobacteraceae bacterium]|jgi:hypothetical protein|nr:hypothetical protein [Rhodanobacteraceae bacterium]
MSTSFVRAAFVASLLLFVAGCEQKPAETNAPVAANANTPEATIRRSADLLKQGDLAGFMQNALPPAEFAKAKADWKRDANEKPVTDEDRAKFAETMTKLTAPDAEQALFAEIEPQLKEFDATYQQQMPMYVAMGSGWLQGMVQQNKDMSEASKQQALAAINALTGWVQKTRFTDPEAIRKVLAITVKAAREINLKTLDEARALDFDASMAKARIAFVGFKAALAVYGFSFDQLLDSIKPEVIENDGKTAKVKVSYMLFDTPLSAETEMVNVDGRWYGKDAMEKLEHKAEDAGDEAETTDAAGAD